MSALENTYKQSGTFAGKIGNTLVSLLKIMLRSKFGVRMPITNDKTCIILGNGPSLSDSLKKHPDFFKKHPLICVNAFSLSKEYETLQPANYVILDPSFFMESNDFLKSVITSIATKTAWPLQLFIPFRAKNSIYLKEIRENKNIRINYFNYTVFKGFDYISHWFLRKNLAMLQSQNVLVASIFLSINIGFREVFIVGADHTWHQALHVDENNRLCIKDVHFYDNEEKVSYKPFRVSQTSDQTHRMDEILTIWGKTFYGYIAMNNYANYRGVNVYNASEVSFIDAFKRVKL